MTAVAPSPPASLPGRATLSWALLDRCAMTAVLLLHLPLSLDARLSHGLYLTGVNDCSAPSPPASLPGRATLSWALLDRCAMTAVLLLHLPLSLDAQLSHGLYLTGVNDCSAPSPPASLPGRATLSWALLDRCAMTAVLLLHLPLSLDARLSHGLYLTGVNDCSAPSPPASLPGRATLSWALLDRCE